MATYYLAFGTSKRPWKVFHTCHSIAKKETSSLNRFLRRILLSRNVVTNIAISKEVSKTFIEYYGKKYKVPIINNGIALAGNLKSVSHKDYDFVVVGRFVPLKNHKFLISSLHRYSLESNRKIRSVFVGGGPTLNDCIDYAKTVGVDKYIKFEGEVDDVYPFLNNSKVFLLGSLYEGNPISILEAIDCGLPVISTNVGGIKDVITNGVNGFLYEINNYDELKKCFDSIFNQRIYNAMIEANISLREKISIEHTAKEYIKIFKGA